jgi:hypothetical protein
MNIKKNQEVRHNTIYLKKYLQDSMNYDSFLN